MQKEVRDWSSEILMLVKEFEVKAADSPRRRPPQSAAQPSPTLPLENYAGLYENDLYGQAQVTCEKGQLKMHLGQIEALLIPMRDNAFMISEPIMYVGRMPVFFIQNNERTIHLFKLRSFLKEVLLLDQKCPASYYFQTS